MEDLPKGPKIAGLPKLKICLFEESILTPSEHLTLIRKTSAFR